MLEFPTTWFASSAVKVKQMELATSCKTKVLVIDDDVQIRRLLLEIFRDRYECWEVGSAEEALLVLAQERFDLVISDINMGE